MAFCLDDGDNNMEGNDVVSAGEWYQNILINYRPKGNDGDSELFLATGLIGAIFSGRNGNLVSWKKVAFVRENKVLQKNVERA